MEEIATRYLFLDLTIRNLELDIEVIMSSQLKIKEPYFKLVTNAIIKAKSERRKLHKLMYGKNIKVKFLYKDGQFSHYKFYLGGKSEEVIYFNPVIKKNVEEIMREFLEHP